MALPDFFDRVYSAIGGHLAVSRHSLEKALGQVSVGIRCGSDISVGDFWIAELATNIVARLYPRITITADPLVFASLQTIAKTINPRIEFQEAAPPNTTIAIGTVGEEGTIYPYANGWVARVFRETSPAKSSHPNPYASAAAAAMACSELFRRVFLSKTTDRQISISLLDFSPEGGADTPLQSGNIGEVLFAGVGAVGNAAIWALCRDPTREGHLRLVDPEDLTLLNLQRYVLGRSQDVGTAKVKIAERTFRGSKIFVSKFKKSLENYAKKHGGIDVPTICISVDNVDSRRSAQALLPKLIVNGWTGGEALGASWHIFSNGKACLACLYHPHGRGPSATEQAAKALGLDPDRAAILWVTRQPLSTEDVRAASASLGVTPEALSAWNGKSLGELYTDLVCGAAPVDVEGLGKLEVVPLAHQSVMAGILMAAELVKRTDEQLSLVSQQEPLVSWDDILGAPPPDMRRPRPRESGCICGDKDFQKVYAEKWLSHSS